MKKIPIKINFEEARVKALVEAFKELARIFALATIPLVIDAINKQTFDWRLIVGTGVVAVLRAINEYIHVYGKETKNPLLEPGLTRF